MKIPKLLAILILLAAAVQAQPAHLVQDIAPNPPGFNPSPASSSPGQFLTAQGKLFFEAAGDVWVTDGTPSGTKPLPKGCSTGACEVQIVGSLGNLAFWTIFLEDSFDARGYRLLVRSDGTRAGTFVLAPASDWPPAILGRFLYFQACTPGSGCELWRTDGTPGGTGLFRDLTPGAESSHPRYFTALGDKVVFQVNGAENGVLWMTDGTAVAKVADLPGYVGRPFTALGEKAVFSLGPSFDIPEEFWVTDGTSRGTRLLLRLPEPDARFPWIKSVGNRAYFLANDVLHGMEIWRSDGTPAGTVRVTDCGYHDPFHEDTLPIHLAEAGGRLVFMASDGLTRYQLWATSGTSGSPTLLSEVCEGGCYDNYSELAAVRGKVVFRGSDEFGDEPWATDGTVAGTRRLAVTDADPFRGMYSVPRAVRGLAYFSALNQLWRSDGTAAGTRPLTRLLHPNRVALPLQVTVLGDKAIFPVDGPYGAELWASDGTAEGTSLLADIVPQARSSSIPKELATVGERAFFNTSPGFGAKSFWGSGGLPESTTFLGVEESCTLEPAYPTRAAGRLFFNRKGPLCATELWVTDGTPAGTSRIAEKVSTSIRPFVFQDRYFFHVFRQEGGFDLWKSDGTLSGTGPASSMPPELSGRDVYPAGPELYFFAEDSAGENQVWRSDGTPAGTRRVSDFVYTDWFRDFSPHFVRVGNLVYFLAAHNGHLWLWRTNGMLEGTVQLAGPFDDDSAFGGLTSFRGALFYFAPTNPGFALWRSDGTPEGTVPFRTLSFYDQFSEFSPAIRGDHLYFFATDELHGRELWKTDGTLEGTVLVKDIVPGKPGATPRYLTAAGGRLFFQADDGFHGAELWESDGTEAGTRMTHDIFPLLTSSFPGPFAAAEGFLYFAADDGVHGRELWALPLGGRSACQPSTTTLCLGGGRFKVEAVWRDFAENTGIGQAVALTPDTGYFWFFNPENVEAVIKVLDGRGVNGHHWVFYGALSNVEYEITVTDMETGLTRRYLNPWHNFASVGDTYGFGPLGATKARDRTAPASPEPIVKERFDPAAATGVCAPSATRLCLNGGRFAVEVSWKDFSNRTGVGTAVNLTPDTGYFWFFNAENVELMVKVLDGRPITGKFWVFYGALSNVEYTLTVMDTQTGISKEYENPSGRFGSIGDTGAF